MNPLISAEDLRMAVQSPQTPQTQRTRQKQQSPSAPVLLDVRWSLATGPDRAAFDRDHLPGARFVDLDADLAGPPGPAGRHPMPDPDVFGAAMRAAGVDADSAVVVYDAGPATAAARAWWLLRHFGHRDVRVLDGGLARWTALGLPTVSAETPAPAPLPPPGDFRALRRGPDGSIGSTTSGTTDVGTVLALDEVLPFAERGVLLDARTPERFRGDSEPVDPVAGHIPGAVNAPSGANLSDDGTFLSAGELRRRFAPLVDAGSAGGRARLPIAAYCGSGITAAQEVLALAIAGYSAALFPGSWSQWVADPARPVATGGQ